MRGISSSIRSLAAKFYRPQEPQPQSSRHGLLEEIDGGDNLSTPDMLCSNCKTIFEQSRTLRKALATHLTSEEYKIEAAANSAKYQELEKTYEDMRHRAKQQLGLELSQRFGPSRYHPDDMHTEESKENPKILSTARDDKEHFLLHSNLQSLENSIRLGKCHFCTLVRNLIFQTPYDDLDNRAQDTVIRIQISESHNSVNIEVQLSRGDDIGVIERAYRRGQASIYVAKITKSNNVPTSDPLSSDVRYTSTTGSKSHFQLGHFWLRECLGKHPFCDSKTIAFSPARLLEIHRSSRSGGFSVKLSQNHSADATYCALSYRWGGLPSAVTLKSETLAKFEHEIPFEKLPKTIWQAIEITYELGLRYLWIDCLCIVQNSESDWALQSRQMCSIYEHAVCTIAAESARNIDEGLFKARSPLTYMPCELLSDNLNCMDDGAGASRNDSTPIACSFFGIFGVTWICKQGQADEWNPEGEGTKRGAAEGVINPRITNESRTIFGPKARILDWEAELDRGGDLHAGRGDFFFFSKRLLDGAPLSPQEVHRRWFGIVGPYSETELTFESDRLVALAGLAARVQSKTGFHYLAGIWRESLPFDLLWTLKGELGPGRRAYSLAPTWSWASIRGEVLSWVFWGYDVPPEDILCSYESCDIRCSDPADVHNIGAVFSASLTIRAKVRRLPYKRPSLESSPIKLETFTWLGAGKGSKTIYDPSGAILGQLHPDTTSPDWSTVYLLPVMKSYRDPGFRSMQQIDPWSQNASSRFSELRKSILGLALTKLSIEAHRYKRLGVFHFDYDTAEDLAARWFDDQEEQNIVIW